MAVFQDTCSFGDRTQASIAFERVQGLLDFGLLQVVFCDRHCIGCHRVFHVLPGQRVCNCIHAVDANLIGALSDEGLDKAVANLRQVMIFDKAAKPKAFDIDGSFA